MAAADYYRTALHWSQTALTQAAVEIPPGMGLSGRESSGGRETADLFRGVYPGQPTWPMTYFALSGLRVKYLDTDTLTFE
jgi:hypothetical protein